jgi:hypothetical protein
VYLYISNDPHNKQQIFPLNINNHLFLWRKFNISFEVGTKYLFIIEMNFDMSRVRSAYGEKRNGYKVLVGGPEGKRTLGGPRYTWVDNVKMDRREIRWDYMD